MSPIQTHLGAGPMPADHRRWSDDVGYAPPLQPVVSERDPEGPVLPGCLDASVSGVRRRAPIC